MTRNEIIRMAREAGFLCDEDWVTYGLPGFERFAALVAAAEREACADIAENWRCNGAPRTVLADQIRARSTNEVQVPPR
jgi:hypothetical protein